MYRLFLLVFALPWYGVAVVSALMLWVAQSEYDAAQSIETEKAQALRAELPPAVPLDEFTPDARHTADEVHVTAWVNTDQNYHLVKRRLGVDDEWMMYVLYGPEDTENTKTARAVALIQPDEVEEFAALVIDGATFTADGRFFFDLNGRVLGWGGYRSLISGALKKEGLTEDPDFIVVAPFLHGRAAGLAPDPLAVAARVAGPLAVAVGLALLALVKFARRNRRTTPASAGSRQMPQSPAVPDLPMPAPKSEVTSAAAVPQRPLSAVDAAFARPNTPGSAVSSDREWSPFAAVVARHGRPLIQGSGNQGALNQGPVTSYHGASDAPMSQTGPIREMPRADPLRTLRAWLPFGIGALVLAYSMAFGPALHSFSPAPSAVAGLDAPSGQRDGAFQPEAGAPIAPAEGASDGPSVPQNLLAPSMFNLKMLLLTCACALPPAAFQQWRRRRAAGPGDPWRDRLR